MGALSRRGMKKNRVFDQYLALGRKRYDIRTYVVTMGILIGTSHTVYRLVSLRMTSSDL